MPVAKKQTAKKPVKRVRKKTGNILDKIQTIDFSNSEPFSVGVFGKPSSGKTTFASSFPGRILYASCSGGLKKPGELRSVSKKDREKFDQITITECEQLNEITEAVSDSEEHSTVVLDNLTSFSDLCLEQITKKPVPAQLSWGYATKQDWGKHGALMKSFLRNLLNLPKYVVIISQERWFEPPEGSEIGIPVVGPAATPTVAGWLVASLDYSAQFYTRAETKSKTITINGSQKNMEVKTGNVEFCAYLPFCEDRMTKFRKPKGTEVQKVLLNPTFEGFASIIEGG